jgi:hypothetical protein
MIRISPPVRRLLAKILSFLLITAGTIAAVSAALEPAPGTLLAALLLYALLAVPMLRRPAERPVPIRVTRR